MPADRIRVVERAGPDQVRQETTPSGKGESFSAPVAGDQEVVLDAQPAAAVPVAAGLDREHHALGDLAAAGLVGVRRLVCTRADAVTDRVRRLARVADRGDALAHEHVELGEARAWAAVRDRAARTRRAARPRARGSRRAARRGRAASCGRPSSRRRRPRSRTASARRPRRGTVARRRERPDSAAPTRRARNRTRGRPSPASRCPRRARSPARSQRPAALGHARAQLAAHVLHRRRARSRSRGASARSPAAS